MMNSETNPPLGSLERPLKVAVIGAGPSGFFAAEGLLRRPSFSARVDLYDRLPSPYGLVRGGVAPDHQNIKMVARGFERLAALEGFRFFGNISLGQHVKLSELFFYYDAVVLAVGNEVARGLEIPGSDLPGCYTSQDLVGWYNGHPDHTGREVRLRGGPVVIVGVGNVALDLCRLLVSPPSRLAPTDITQGALEGLAQESVEEVTVLGRRGPGQAAFSPQEIKRIAELPGVYLDLDPAELALTEEELEALPHADAKRNVLYLREQAALRTTPEGERDSTLRRVSLRFYRSPLEVLEEGGAVGGIRVKRALPGAQEVMEDLPARAVLAAVGYRGSRIPGVPYDERIQRIPNEEGRVIVPETGAVLPGLYVVGWAKRGPRGLIGANRSDAFEVVERLVGDLEAIAPAPQKEDEELLTLLKERQPALTTFEDWKRIDAAEVARGAEAGKLREKFTTVQELLSPLKRDGA